LGQEIAADRSLPRLRPLYQARNAYLKSRGIHHLGVAGNQGDDQKQRCWKALLLKPEEDDADVNEWDLVRGHFEKSRSKKVLSIIQSK